jgi:hypothetical protein
MGFLKHRIIIFFGIGGIFLSLFTSYADDKLGEEIKTSLQRMQRADKKKIASFLAKEPEGLKSFCAEEETPDPEMVADALAQVNTWVILNKKQPQNPVGLIAIQDLPPPLHSAVKELYRDRGKKPKMADKKIASVSALIGKDYRRQGLLKKHWPAVVSRVLKVGSPAALEREQYNTLVWGAQAKNTPSLKAGMACGFTHQRAYLSDKTVLLIKEAK